METVTERAGAWNKEGSTLSPLAPGVCPSTCSSVNLLSPLWASVIRVYLL